MKIVSYKPWPYSHSKLLIHFEAAITSIYYLIPKSKSIECTVEILLVITTTVVITTVVSVVGQLETRAPVGEAGDGKRAAEVGAY